MKSTAILVLFILMQISERRNGVLSCGELQSTSVDFLPFAQTTHRWPWHVAIYHRDDKSIEDYKCGGTLISSEAILTAAHCVHVDAALVSVSVGKFLLNDNTKTISVAKIILHPWYREEYLANDIAIILLPKNIVTFNNYVQPVCLWRSDFTENIGDVGTVVGWGRTETGNLSNELRQASLRVINTYTCLDSYRDVFGQYLSNSNFCAGQQDGKSVCNADSGEAMTFQNRDRYYIRGIVSFGPSNINKTTNDYYCDPVQYVVFTDVAKYIPWIKSSVIIVECDGRVRWVRCSWSEGKHICTAILGNNIKSAFCKIIFDEASNPAVTELKIKGESDDIPEFLDAADKFRNLDSLVFENISLKTVHKKRLNPFTNIKKLDLSQNLLNEFLTDPFIHLLNLEILYLDRNEFEMLPVDMFQENVRLRELDLSENNLKEVHAHHFAQLIHLEILYLHENMLAKLDENLFRENTKLRELDLSKNNLKEVHDHQFARLIDLEILYLHENGLAKLDENLFRNNTKLRELSISNNDLRSIHVDQFKGLRDLGKINLNKNRIGTIPPGLFRDNIKLKEIYLNYLYLKEVPVNLFEHLTDLEILYLNENGLKTLPEGIFKNNANLKTLSLPVNLLNKLHADLLTELFNLETLHLHENSLESLPAGIFRNNKKLRYLHLSQNRLKKLDSDVFRALNNLEEIYLFDNALETIPSGLFRYNGKLASVQLSSNKISKIAPDFLQITNIAIKTLNLNDNVCIEEFCGYGEPCDALTLRNIFDRIRENC